MHIFIKLGRHVHYDKRMNPIDFIGQRSKVKVTIDTYRNKLVNTIETKPLCASSSNLADMLTIVRGWTLLILEVKVTIDTCRNKLVNMIETKPLCASSSNFADMLAIVRGWTLLILEIRGQRSRSQ